MKKSTIYTLIAALMLALVAFMFFFPDDVQGNVLQQHDIMQGIANGQEGKAFAEATGQSTRWTDSLFGGMPNFQIAPSYPANSMLDWIAKVYMLFLPSPANLLFGMMLGFFIMSLCFGMKWQDSLFGALAWGFSSYFIIIIGAGHIWKFLTLCYIPPTIGGLALLYRGRYALGVAVAALFGALQLQSNHPQMSYYFILVILCLMVAWLVTAWHQKRMRQWVMATLLAAGAGILAVGANSASLYNSLEYSKETVRGRSTELTAAGASDAQGMNREAITAWSYSPSETFSLLIPNVKGGATIKPRGGENHLLSTLDTPSGRKAYLSPDEAQFAAQFPQYFGDQPMTNGPVYVGAFVLLLAILGLFTLHGAKVGPLKWALLTASVLAVLLSWGHNFSPFTDFFIDHFPGYNKFRAVASILVIVEFALPFLAALTLRQMATEKDYFRTYRTTIWAVMGFGGAVCLIGWLAPGIFGSTWSASETEFLTGRGILGNPAYANVLRTVTAARESMVSSDCLRSLLFIAGGCLILWMWARQKSGGAGVWILSLSALVLVDLFTVDKRYVDSSNFVADTQGLQSFEPTEADRYILQDTTHYRVMDADGFGEARSSYFHNTIGGYHAAKLTRYNDLIDRQISKSNMQVLNMLNAKYFIHGGQAYDNPDAYGNGWMVDTVLYAPTPNAEMQALDTLPTRTMAVAGDQFKSALGTSRRAQPGDTVQLLHYAPNHLAYRTQSASGGVAVFSEIYFPWGWKAEIDGKPAEIGRVDYVLRALRVPAGSHKVTFTFDPESLRVTNGISIASVCVIYLLIAGGAFAVWRRYRKEETPEP